MRPWATVVRVPTDAGTAYFKATTADLRHEALVTLPIEAVEGVAVYSGHPDASSPSRPAIGANATVLLPDGRRRTAQVDGGNGHSGKRSPDLHFGLGDLPRGRTVTVELQWRDVHGQIQHRQLVLLPGWHTILLGSGAGEG